MLPGGGKKINEPGCRRLFQDYDDTKTNIFFYLYVVLITVIFFLSLCLFLSFFNTWLTLTNTQCNLFKSVINKFEYKSQKKKRLEMENGFTTTAGKQKKRDKCYVTYCKESSVHKHTNSVIDPRNACTKL